MQPQEILPSPEIKDASHNLEANDGATEVASARSVEIKKSSTQGAAALSGAAVGNAQSAVQGAQGPASIGISAAGSTVQVDVPQQADDIDLIEKEWVNKAKQIVEQTSGDPHMQNQQLNKMKIEYIQKRYSKEVKKSDDQ